MPEPAKPWPRKIIVALAAAFLVCGVEDLDSESVTLTTYYPAPSGVYTKMITTNDTYLARDGGSVGIGVTSLSPGVKLEMGGVLRVANYPASSESSLPGVEGGLYFDTTNHIFKGF